MAGIVQWVSRGAWIDNYSLVVDENTPTTQQNSGMGFFFLKDTRGKHEYTLCFYHLFLRGRPPDFYPAYRRVKAGKNGRGLAFTGLYAG